MICPICKSEIPDDTKFCGKCGTKIPRCPSCGKAILTRSRFCTYDGTPLPEDIISVLPETPYPERADINSSFDMQDLNENEFFDPGIYENDPDAGEERKEHRTGLIILIIVLAVIIAFAAIFAFLFFTDRLPDINFGGTAIESESSGETEADTTAEASEEEETESEEETTENETTEETDEEAAEDEVSFENLEGDDAVQYFILNSDTIYFTEDDLEGWTADMCRKARNGIYARHGRLFDDEELQAYFDSCDWYEGTVDPDDFDESVFNDYEKANRDLIVAYETEMGYR